MEVTKDKIVDVFGLNPNYTANFRRANLYVEYEGRIFAYREAILVRHRRNRKKFIVQDAEPFECEEFEDYLKNTYYCLNQVLAQDFGVRIAPDLLVMVVDIQEYNRNTGFDYANFVAQQTHEDFLNLKKEVLPLYFPHYSLLMHMLLWEGDYEWKRKLNLRIMDSENDAIPVQMWTYIWDQDCSNSYYILFVGLVRHDILKSLGVAPRFKISLEIRSLMCQKDILGSAATHNWADWFFYSKYTLIRVYGAKVAPHCLPLYVSDKLDFIELMWKIDVMDYEMFRKDRKGFVVYPQCSFSYFKVIALEGYEKMGIMVNNLRMPIDEVRVFDPEIFVAGRRRKKNLGIIHHDFFYKDDVLRNLTSDEVVMVRKKECTTMTNLEENIMKKNAFYITPHNEIANPLERAFTMIRDYQSGEFKVKLKEAVNRAQVLLEKQ